jgi:hypothetical protein
VTVEKSAMGGSARAPSPATNPIATRRTLGSPASTANQPWWPPTQSDEQTAAIARPPLAATHLISVPAAPVKLDLGSVYVAG